VKEEMKLDLLFTFYRFEILECQEKLKKTEDW
jgi:hypothetical protein